MKIPSTAPTTSDATAPMTTDATMAAVPEPTSQGRSGSSAPKAKVKNDADRRLPGRAQRTGVDAELLAGVGLERELGVPHHLVDQLACHRRVDPPPLVDGDQLVAARPSGLRRSACRSTSSSRWSELALGLHRDVLAGRHGEGAGHQAGHPGQPDHDRRPGGPRPRRGSATRWSPARRSCRTPPPGPAAGEIAVLVVVVAGRRRRSSCRPLARLRHMATSVATPRRPARWQNRSVPERQWIDQSQPQTLQAAVMFSYLNAALAILYLILTGRAVAPPGPAGGRRLRRSPTSGAGPTGPAVVVASLYLLVQLILFFTFIRSFWAC